MPNLDLSALNGAELRRLLDSSRERGLATQSYQILEEMARRREAGPQRRSRRPAEPRVISMELGDPLERRDDFAEAEPEPPPDPAANLTLGRAPREGRRRWGLPAGTFVAGAAMGVALGAWLASGGAETPSSSAELAVLQAEIAAPTPIDAPAPPTVEPAPAAEPPAPDMAETSAALPTSEAPEAAAQSETTPEAAEEPPQASTAEAEGCLAAAETPADRTICADPDLQRLQRDLRRAYAEAIEAHADRTILRQRQLAWRDARSPVTDPARLAALYEERIRKLNAATEDARRQR
ncbi:MAG: hypothetical protein A2790_09530 [Phenylobacterium sp. RIFCSPHIGHO2_01_FULL_69_31]|uniref:hypothetical protein n=1 Tax=Phenylobacterium sp. RIFCSPHIGHO2_01_FULL_69_31 TaxID=1801944 RepID=UPI0008C18576|nr:hypothetical protein [Phenylobacterium sp. RIFCSPHIGHO2_01_FULL_69_31]OHB30897.1 MAG: hypothetical protein A2790_09530 [Phenylobacterium sp. RIFCSPHIGHO2_01_FULL_69_31]